MIVMPGIMRARVVGSFTPAVIFASGATGAWYDPSDLSTLFQDTAGTNPVTASGQTVALMLDKSGAGWHVQQATAASRPVFQESGGLRWLDYDGVNDRLQPPSARSPLAQPLTMWSAARLNTSPPAALRALYDSFTGTNRITTYVNTSGVLVSQGVGTFGTQAMTSAADFVCSVRFDNTNSSQQVDNGSVVSGSIASAVSPDGFNVGSSQGARFWDGRIYGIVIAGGDQLAAYGSQTKAWLAAKQGRTL